MAPGERRTPVGGEGANGRGSARERESAAWPQELCSLASTNGAAKLACPLCSLVLEGAQ